MTQESISDFVQEYAEKLAAILGNSPTPHVYPQGISINTETGEVSTIPPRKGRYKTPAESFHDLHSEVIKGMYQFKVESILYEGLNEELLLIDLREDWINHQREAENLFLKIRELKYFIEYNPDNWPTTEGLKEDLKKLQYDQIKEQMFADFYKLVISDLTTKETPQKPQLQKSVAFFLAIFVLGRLGKVKEFPFNGTSTNEARDSVTMAAQWAMNEFGGEYNLKTLHSYLKTSNVNFVKHIDTAEVFLLYHYPNEELKIKSEFLKIKSELTKLRIKRRD